MKELFDRLQYEPDTGVFRWRWLPGKKAWLIGAKVYLRRGVGGYKTIGLKIDGKHRQFRAHRVAWLLMTGDWPKAQIDHVNRIKDDNRWVNLREATNAQNQFNVRRRQTNTLGFKNILKTASGTFQVQITANGKRHCIGTYPKLEEAVAVRDMSLASLHGEFANAD